MKSKSCFIFALLTCGSVAFAAAPALPFVSPMFGDNMILQQGKTNVIWGWTKAGERVRVELAGQTAETVTDGDGRWQVRLLPPNSANELTLRIS